MATSRGVEWLAGLMEGEGCFTRQRGRTGTITPIVSVVMTDRDVVESARVLMEGIGGRAIRLQSRGLMSGKTAWDARTSGMPAIKIMLAVLPFMGERRAHAIRRLITAWSPKQLRGAVAFASEIRGIQGVFP
jgi:hypothetical protein